MRRVSRAVLGGTFDHLHAGHEALLATAARRGRSLAVGITTTKYLAAHPKPDGRRIQSYAVRRRAVARWLDAHFPRVPYELRPLEDTFGRSTEPGVDLLVVSADTARGGHAVNAERRRRGLPTVPVVVVPLVLADDLVPVSSRRIRSGEIDRDGRRRAPIAIDLRVSAERDRAWAESAVRGVFRNARFRASRSEPSLEIAVARRAGGGWTVAESNGPVRLRPRTLGAGSPTEVRRRLVRLLRPGGPAP